MSQHCLSVNGKRKHIEREDLLEVAKKMNIKGATELIDQVDQVIGKWNDYADEQKVEPALRKAIGRTLLRLQ